MLEDRLEVNSLEDLGVGAKAINLVFVFIDLGFNSRDLFGMRL
jgi:hypothetical protein